MRSAISRILIYTSIWSGACGVLGLISLYAPDRGEAGGASGLHRQGLYARPCERTAQSPAQSRDDANGKPASRPPVIRPPVDRESDCGRQSAKALDRAADTVLAGGAPSHAHAEASVLEPAVVAGAVAHRARVELLPCPEPGSSLASPRGPPSRS